MKYGKSKVLICEIMCYLPKTSISVQIVSEILEYCNADRTTWKLTLQDINTTPKELKTERDVAIDSCFGLFGARQYGVTTRDQALMKKYPRTLILAMTENS